jgi:hypothetical protein
MVAPIGCQEISEASLKSLTKTSHQGRFGPNKRGETNRSDYLSERFDFLIGADGRRMGKGSRLI